MNLKEIMTKYAKDGDPAVMTTELTNAIQSGGKVQCPPVLRVVGAFQREGKVVESGTFKALVDAETAGTLFDPDPVTAPTPPPKAAVPLPKPAPVALPVVQEVPETPAPKPVAESPREVPLPKPAPVPPPAPVVAPSQPAVHRAMEFVLGQAPYTVFTSPLVLGPLTRFLRELADGIDQVQESATSPTPQPVEDLPVVSVRVEEVEASLPSPVVPDAAPPAPAPAPVPTPAQPATNPVGTTTANPIWSAVSADVKTIFPKKADYAKYTNVVIPITLLWRRPPVYLWRFLAMYSGHYSPDQVIHLCTGGEKISADAPIEIFGNMTFRAVRRQLRDIKNGAVPKVAEGGWDYGIGPDGTIFVRPMAGYGAVDGDSIY